MDLLLRPKLLFPQHIQQHPVTEGALVGPDVSAAHGADRELKELYLSRFSISVIPWLFARRMPG